MIKKLLTVYFGYVASSLSSAIFLPVLLVKKQKSIAFYKIFWLNWIKYKFLICYTLINNSGYVDLSFISSGLEFWSVKHTSLYENSESKVFENIKFSGEISNNWTNDLLGTDVYITFEHCW